MTASGGGLGTDAGAEASGPPSAEAGVLTDAAADEGEGKEEEEWEEVGGGGGK